MSEYVLDLDPIEEAMLATFECPVCMNINSESDIMGHYRKAVNTLVHSELKQFAEVKRVRCQRCGSVFENKTYL